MSIIIINGGNLDLSITVVKDLQSPTQILMMMGSGISKTSIKKCHLVPSCQSRGNGLNYHCSAQVKKFELSFIASLANVGWFYYHWQWRTQERLRTTVSCCSCSQDGSGPKLLPDYSYFTIGEQQPIHQLLTTQRLLDHCRQENVGDQFIIQSHDSL